MNFVLIIITSVTFVSCSASFATQRSLQKRESIIQLKTKNGFKIVHEEKINQNTFLILQDSNGAFYIGVAGEFSQNEFHYLANAFILNKYHTIAVIKRRGRKVPNYFHSIEGMSYGIHSLEKFFIKGKTEKKVDPQRLIY